MTMTKIYLIRHGEAEGNIFRRLHGQYDSLLTPRGCAQAACVRERFADIPIDACFSSDLTRACMTARSIFEAKQLPLRRDARFREVDVGSWEDIPYGYLDNFEEARMRQFNDDPPKWHVPGSERFDDYTERFIAGMRSAAERFDGGTIAIFSHGAVMRGTLMRLFFGGDPTIKQPYSDNTGVSCLVYHGGEFRYEFLNDNSHLPDALSTFYVQRWWRSTGNRKEAGLYFVPASQTPPPIALPETDGCGMTAMLCGRAVGGVALGAPDGKTGRIRGMCLLPELAGRYYGDQLLGCAVSHFRRLGCTEISAAPGAYPDDLLRRYAFDENTRSRSIDTKAFDWGNAT